MAQQYRIGVIGHTGQGNYGHGLDIAWRAVPQATVMAVADPNPQGLEAAIKKTQAARGYSDYRKMLEQEQLDIVSVCPRWIDQHHAMALACAEHGCHMYLEKPFCRTLQEADDIVNACEMRHLKLAIAHQSRYSPILEVVKGLIAEGRIGDVLEFRARGKEDRRGGAEDLWVLGTHLLDLIRAFHGDPESCYAQVTQQGQPVTATDVYEGNEGIGALAGDGVEATYKFADGVTGFFSSNRNAAGSPSRWGLRIYGTKGIIEYYTGMLTPAYILEDPAWSPGRTGAVWKPISSNGVGEPETRKDSDNQRGNDLAVIDLIDAIENDRQPRSGLYDARAATEMIAAVFESHRLGRRVEFPLVNRQNPLTLLKA